jgi:hypothetical protein
MVKLIDKAIVINVKIHNLRLRMREKGFIQAIKSEWEGR